MKCSARLRAHFLLAGNIDHGHGTGQIWRMNGNDPMMAALAAGTSTLSTPVPARAITRRRGAAAISWAVTVVALDPEIEDDMGAGWEESDELQQSDWRLYVWTSAQPRCS